MARPKKIKEEELEQAIENVVAPEPVLEAPIEVIPTPIDKLSVDYPSEGLNNMARKVNELIDKLNTL